MQKNTTSAPRTGNAMPISDVQIQKAVATLSNALRAENIQDQSYLGLYVGEDALHDIHNLNNQVIYGRRGSGKTHLLKALQEKINNDFAASRRIAVYIDARTILPHAEADGLSWEQYAVILFKNIIRSLVNAFSSNLRAIHGRDDIIPLRRDPLDAEAERQLQHRLEAIQRELDGSSLNKLKETALAVESIAQAGASLKLSKAPELQASGSLQTKSQESRLKDQFISVFDIANLLQDLSEELQLNRVFCLIDEWSEIPNSAQKHLAELVKKSFIASCFSFKIAAIPNRTDLGHKTDEKFYGLEDGGDIFGYQLDNRYVFEIDKAKTRNFFNQLLCKHLEQHRPSLSDELLLPSRKNNDAFINAFLTNKALGELLIASAGIPRDFINLFIHSYAQFKSSGSKHISIKNVRAATSGWYETDKKKQVDEHSVEKNLLEKIVQEIVVGKNSSHFMISEKYSANPHILGLVDFRVLHLRKKGYSHKDMAGETFNVYSIDYGCYNHLNITRTALDNNTLENLKVRDDIRDIRRIHLSDAFFQKFQLAVGEAFMCEHCKKPVDTTHAAFVKQSLCNHCFEKIPARSALAA